MTVSFRTRTEGDRRRGRREDLVGTIGFTATSNDFHHMRRQMNEDPLNKPSRLMRTFSELKYLLNITLNQSCSVL